MSNYLRNNDDARRETTSPIRRRRVWLATGVVGLTGAVSLAGVAYATTGAIGPHRLADVKWSTAQQLTKDGDHGERNRADERGRDGKEREERGRKEGRKEERDEFGRVREVPCKNEKLVEAIDLANRDRGGTLKLAPHCTYELAFADRKNGTALPTIRQEIVIKRNDATIKRRSEADFRLFRVADGGDLILKDLTIKDGNAAEFKYGEAPKPPMLGAPDGLGGSDGLGAPDGQVPSFPQQNKTEGDADGGALLVERGGSAHLDKVNLLGNNAEGNGGAIANFGRVELENSTVENNHARRNGGGIFNVGILTVKDSCITNNTAGENGGGIANGEGKEVKEHKDGKDGKDGSTTWLEGRDRAGSVEIFKTSIENNRAGDNGGGVFSSGGFVKIVLSTIKQNTACKNGGGIYARNTNLDLDKVTVEKNHADRDGGGIYNTGGEKKKEGPMSMPGKDRDNEPRATATINESSILDNSAGRFGGGIFNGEPNAYITEGFLEDFEGKDGRDDNATLTIRCTDIKGNTALNGGGIFNNEGRVDLTNTRISKNTATDATKTRRVAGGILNNHGTVRFDETTTISDNDPTNCAGTVKQCFN
ncbi:hypothetical protein ABZ671_26755 [Micromonospora sp. NPDC006766]|uniref:hypothetical protein n=1 Tax=Micromonospora sp. NPDC006766 TaxID=3154778 RepID=UPI0033D720D2